MKLFKQSLVCTTLLLFFCLGAFGQARYVVVVTIDGGASYHLDDPTLELPNIHALIATGVRAESSETVFPSVTHPSHTTIITGVMPRKHGVLANELAERNSDRLLPGNSLTRSKIILTKTIFDTAKAKGLYRRVPMAGNGGRSFHRFQSDQPQWTGEPRHRPKSVL
jgi:hypothetical protein